jgi:DNA replication and repair protein RecF
LRRSLAIERLSIRGFRNLTAVDVTLGPRFNVLAGDNGQGKTNFLEAAYTVLTSKSFRASRPGDLVRHGDTIASVRASILDDGNAREQSVGLKAGSRIAKVDGKKAETLASYAVLSPVVVFHPGEMTLSMGGGAERRKLLDRVALHLAPHSLADLESSVRALRERQRALEARGVEARDLDHWEELAVRHGLSVLRTRGEAANRLASAAVAAFGRIAAPGLELTATYAPGAPTEEEAYRAKLRERRVVDLRRGAATVGPHRDELQLAVSGHGARGYASQGQHRAIVLALKLAEIEVIAETRGVLPILLLDDVSSELDRSRTAALFAALRDHYGQVLLTTTRPELVDVGALQGAHERIDFRVFEGSVEVASTPF